MPSYLDPEALYERVARAWMPPEKLSVTEWAESYLDLPADASSQPGLWRKDFAAYQQGVLDALSDPKVDKITFMCSSQVGKTLMCLIAIGYFVDADPSHILYVRESLDKAEEFSKKELTYLFGVNRLSSVLKENKSKETSNTLLKKTFPGGSLILTGSNSAGSLAGLSCRIVILDEISKYSPIPGFGNPIDLAESRTKTWKHNRKILYVSTPAEEKSGSIEELYKSGNQQRFEIPCPHCGGLQWLKWEQVKFQHCRETLDKVFYQCEHCQGQLYQGQLREAVRRGQWIAHGEETAQNKGHVSFWISELYSPFSDMASMVREFLNKKGDPIKFRQFVNESLGETWIEKDQDQVSTHELMKNRESFDGMVPLRCGVLTAGVDTQDDRLEMSLVGWDKGRQSYVLDHKVFFGSPAEPEVWESLYADIEKQYNHESGGTIGVSCVFMDSGGHHTDAVMRFAKPHWPKIVAIRGSNQAGSPLLPVRYKKKGIYKVMELGVTAAKDMLYGRLKISLGEPGSIHFASHLEEEYFLQLMAEKRSPKVVGGQVVTAYKSLRARNEALDCYVYALCALEYWEKSRRKLESTCDYYESLLEEHVEDIEEPDEQEPKEADIPSVEMDVTPIETVPESSKESPKPPKKPFKYVYISNFSGW